MNQLTAKGFQSDLARWGKGREIFVRKGREIFFQKGREIFVKIMS